MDIRAAQFAMLIVPIEQAEPGMKLVMSVLHPEHPDHELLRPGFILDATILATLRSLGIAQLYIDYPDLAELDKHLAPHLSPARQRIYSQVKATIAAVQHTAQPTVTFPDYYIATRELVITLLQQGDHPIYMDILSGSLGPDAVGHAAAVAHLALTLGIRLQTYLIAQRSRLEPRHAREVVNLGVAGMLHDIGKAKLPPHLQHVGGAQPPEEEADRKLWEQHPRMGGDMLSRGVEASATAAVVQHHQHFDGSGFPALRPPGKPPIQLDGERIHVYARILAAADLYERLTIAPDGRKRRWPVQILHLMQTRYASWLDPRVLKMLPSVIPPFPPAARVQLSDGTRAVVSGIDPARPYNPTVRRTAGSGLALSGEPFVVGPGEELSIRRLGGTAVETLVPSSA